MILTIWRHGEAGSAVTDRKRELTENGRNDIELGCVEFREHCAKYDLPQPKIVLLSEWVRTEQTASIIVSVFPEATVQACRALIPGCQPAEVDAALVSLLNGNELSEHLLLVSHQPLVSSLVDFYLGESGQVAPLVPGGLATLELDVVGPGCASLRFSAQPPHYEISQ